MRNIELRIKITLEAIKSVKINLKGSRFNVSDLLVPIQAHRNSIIHRKKPIDRTSRDKGVICNATMFRVFFHVIT